MEREIPLENFVYCGEDILQRLYKECDGVAPLDTNAYLNLEPTEAYKNNRQRIERMEREQAEWRAAAEEEAARVVELDMSPRKVAAMEEAVAVAANLLKKD
jgi:hypothetical protein